MTEDFILRYLYDSSFDVDEQVPDVKDPFMFDKGENIRNIVGCHFFKYVHDMVQNVINEKEEIQDP